jgi:hypothetical protein
MGSSDFRLEHLHTSPFIVQQRVEAMAHLRVVTVGSDAWGARLEAQGLPVDWREAPEAHRRFAAGSLPGDVEASAVAIASQLKLGFSSQDWVIDREQRPWFLDLNPAGQWLFLPESVAQAATQAIARWLSQGRW